MTAGRKAATGKKETLKDLDARRKAGGIKGGARGITIGNDWGCTDTCKCTVGNCW
jgi:hypothetical protein